LSSSDTTATQRLTITQRLTVLRPDSIRNRILAFAVLATLLPSLATAWFSYLENGRSLAAKASEELQGVSMQAAREVDLWFKERRYDLRVFASSYEVTDNLERIQQGGAAVRAGRPLRNLTGYLKSVRERFADYDELLAVDAGGRVVASNRESPDAAATLPEWRAGLGGDELALGRPYWNAVAERPEVLAAVPVGVGGRAALGAIVGRVNLQMLARTLARFEPGESGEIYLVGDDGGVLLGSRGGSAELMTLRYPRDGIQSRLASEGRPIGYINARGQDVLGSARRVPGQDWVVVAEIPMAEAFSALRHLRNVMLLIVAGMLVVAGALGYALGLFIVRPLDRLTRGAAKVASGDLGVDLPVAAGGEVGYLTEVFNYMVARLRASRTELERLSVTDFLTGLNNRRRMMEALDKEVLRSRRLKHPFTVLIADVDNFKQYNDAHGHPAGDEVLRRVATTLAGAIRDVDFIARYGGEEFFVMMPELEASAAAEQAERIRQRIAQETFTGDPVTLSMGMAEFPAHGDSGESLIAAADAALYEAKHAGRNRWAVARPPSAARAAGR
jgi:diguanylate cyclase (GGDEF)-like protein